MNFSYSSSGDEAVVMFLLGFYGIFVGVMALLGIALYVIRSLSVYTIAKRRGLDNPWLSWLPVGHEWILGCLSDQYKFVTQKKRQNRRRVMLGLGIASLVSGLLLFGSAISAAVMGTMDQETAAMGAMLMVAILSYFVLFILAIVSMVFGYMCKYDLYKSCDPKNAVAYLVISIFINVCEPFFLLVCRKKDLGMVSEEPEAPTAAPAQEPKAAAPAEEAPAEPAPTEPAALPAAADTVEETPADE